MDRLIFAPHPALKPFIRHSVYIEIGEKKKWERSNLAPTGCTVFSFALEKLKPFYFYDRLKIVLSLWDNRNILHRFFYRSSAPNGAGITLSFSNACTFKMWEVRSAENITRLKRRIKQ